MSTQNTHGPRAIAFNQRGDFEAMHAAEAWCQARGISVGPTQGPAPRALRVGDFFLAKWRNLTPTERQNCSGVMTGDMRHGPVTITLHPDAAARVKGHQ